MTKLNEKFKNNIFLNSKLKLYDNQVNNNKQENSIRSNRFLNKMGRNSMREIKEKKKEIDMTDEELFPSLLNDHELFSISKTKQKETNGILYKDIVSNKETSIKIESYEIEPGWVKLFRDENNRFIQMQSKITPECLELERNKMAQMDKRKFNEIKFLLREIEYERNLRKELFGDIQEFYDPDKDPFYTKEKDIVLYTSGDLSDSDISDNDTEVSYDNQDNDDNYL